MTVKLIGADDAVGEPFAGDYLRLCQFVALYTGNITELRVKATGSASVKCAIYADSEGEPAALITAMGSQSVVAGWNTLSFTSTPITKDTTYWLACNSSAGANGVRVVASAGIMRYKSFPYGWTFPDPAGSGFTSATYMDLDAGWGDITLLDAYVSDSGSGVDAKAAGNPMFPRTLSDVGHCGEVLEG
jgi:hypothetical protein